MSKLLSDCLDLLGNYVVLAYIYNKMEHRDDTREKVPRYDAKMFR